jgi:hypothetical protein
MMLLLLAITVIARAQEMPSGSAIQNTPAVATAIIQGTILDASGATLSGAEVSLMSSRTGESHRTKTDSEGSYSFTALPADEFTLTVSLSGFDSFTNPDIVLGAGQNLQLPAIALQVAAVSSNVVVTASKQEIAEAQMKSEEKQRLLGFLPNYYVVYFRNPAPLNAGQKMRLAFRQAIDPVNFGTAAAEAGLEANNEEFKEYGTGAEGFGKRYAAAYFDDLTGTIIGSGIVPALLHQDPRYYYKGTGTVRSRILYALSWSFRCKGDNGKWQLNYSFVLGDIAAASISNLYYPKAIRDDAGQMLKYSLFSLASQGVSALLQEFLFKRVTTHANELGKNETSN